MKKKITVVFVIILILFNFIFCNFTFADTEKIVPSEQLERMTRPTDSEGNEIDLRELTKGITDDITSGTSSKGNEDENAAKAGATKKFDIFKYVENSFSTVMGIYTSIWSFLVGGWLNNIPQMIVESTGSTVKNKQFTIYDLVIGNYEFFNLNFYDMESIDKLENTSLAKPILKSVFKFYYDFRNLSLALSLFVLMYIGIRMAISTTSIQKAKYKNMLVAWFTSIFILFFMHYIIIIISYLTHFSLDIVKKLAETWEVTNIESKIVKGQLATLKKGNIGFHLFQTLFLVTAFIYYEFKFLIAYIKRFCEMIFLILISPLVTVTYAIDKVGDNKAQAFATWFKELSVRYALQVVHAITYVIFIAAAGEIAQTVPMLSIFFLWGMGRAEKTIRNAVGLQGAQHVEKAKPPKIPGLPRFLHGRPNK